MTALDAFWHLLNLFAPALLMTAIAAGLAKLLWWRELRQASWLRMWAWAAVWSAVATLVALVVLGHDGQMFGYAGIVAASVLSLWWTGFGPGRR